MFYRSRPAGSYALFIALRSRSLPRPAHRAPHHFSRKGRRGALSRTGTLLTTPSSILRPRTIVRGGTGRNIVEGLASDACGLLHCWGHRRSHSSVASAVVPGATSRARCYAKIFAVAAQRGGFIATGKSIPPRFVRPEKKKWYLEK